MREILDIVGREGPVPPEEIATRLDIPASQVERFLNEANIQGIVLGYRALINWEQTDYEKVYAFIAVQASPEHGKGFDEVAAHISRFEEVHSAYLMSGMADLMVVVEGEDFREIARFVAEKLAPAPGVRNTATSFVLKNYKMEGEIVSEESGNHRLAVTP
jgi:DNA-binding Lrp family transcriptional regulator